VGIVHPFASGNLIFLIGKLLHLNLELFQHESCSMYTLAKLCSLITDNVHSENINNSNDKSNKNKWGNMEKCNGLSTM
jgi:hypothetical protein